MSTIPRRGAGQRASKNENAESSPINGSPVNGSPVNSSLVNGSPVNGNPVNGSLVTGSSVTGSSVTGSSVHRELSRSDEACWELMDEAHEKILGEETSDDEFQGAMDDLIAMLGQKRQTCDAARWQEFIRKARLHRIRELLHEDPFTWRAYSKPRGYAGDAELLDYIYGREELWPPPEASRIGSRVFDYTTLAPSTRGVRERRAFVAETIDRLARETRQPRVLSIAAGHLREASLLACLKRGTLGRLVALDADQRSLREVDGCYGRFGVETVTASFRRLLARKLELGRFDLVYSTGLFDYLSLASARRLMREMFDMLDPGGRLVVANFLPAVRDVGYMEVYMDWHLIYRTRQDMIDITMEIPQRDISSIRLFAEDNQNIIFVQVTRA